MSITKPYPNLYRHGSEQVTSPYTVARRSAEGVNYLASYELLKRDLKEIFAFLEPEPRTLNTFPHRIYELFLRATIHTKS